MNPTLRNALRWLGAIAVGFLWGAAVAWTDATPHWQDFVRHGVAAVVPTLFALKLTLEKQLGIGNPGEKGVALPELLFFVAFAVFLIAAVAYSFVRP